MTRRPGRELEQLPHHVYVHLNAKGEPIYVGRTSDPDARPRDDRKREWMTDSSEVLLSPAMPFEAAMWMETALIQTMAPRHNRNRGQSNRPAAEDWRIDRLCEAEGLDRTTAKLFIRYFPKDEAEFEAYLAKRVAAKAERDAAGIAPPPTRCP